MENKYYTPTIDEFHVGFEYEEYNDWIEQNDNEPTWNRKTIFTHNANLTALNVSLQKNEIRVKHLDPQDIEECGWERDSSSSDWSAFNLKSESKYNHCLTIDVGSKKEIGKNIVIFNNDGVIFKGTIRNKSELRKIMNQCGISA